MLGFLPVAKKAGHIKSTCFNGEIVCPCRSIVVATGRLNGVILNFETSAVLLSLEFSKPIDAIYGIGIVRIE